MRKNNNGGIYPSVMFHRSHFGQLAIGGAMLTRVYEEDSYAEEHEKAETGNGTWHTRFDRNTDGRCHSDLPCHLVAMYVEALQRFHNISEGEMGFVSCDIEVVIRPACYALVVLRTPEQRDWMGKVVKEARQQYVYLQSGFNFSHEISHDGLYDLKDAFGAAKAGSGYSLDKFLLLRMEDGEWNIHRDWHLVAKTRVPGRIRQILHRTINSVKETVDNNFGQGGKFFKLPSKKK